MGEGFLRNFSYLRELRNRPRINLETPENTLHEEPEKLWLKK